MPAAHLCTQVVQALQDADHSVIMLTVDALFTSLHVAREVGICRHPHSATLKCTSASAAAPVFEWEIRDKLGAPVAPMLPFDAQGIGALASKYNLLTTEADFSAAAAACSFDLWKMSQCVTLPPARTPASAALISDSISDISAFSRE